MSPSETTDSCPKPSWLAELEVTRLTVHPDVARKFVDQATKAGALIPNPPELDGAFRLALAHAYAWMGGDVERF